MVALRQPRPEVPNNRVATFINHEGEWKVTLSECEFIKQRLGRKKNNASFLRFVVLGL
jgi:hypothetical protein